MARREAMERALATNVEIAKREGHPSRPAAIEFARKRLMDPSGTWQASMLRDLEAGARVEADHIILDPAQGARSWTRRHHPVAGIHSSEDLRTAQSRARAGPADRVAARKPCMYRLRPPAERSCHVLAAFPGGFVTRQAAQTSVPFWE